MVSVTFDPGQLGIVIGALLGLVAIFLFLRAAWKALKRLFLAPRLEGLDPAAIRRRWAEIETMAASDAEMSLKIAVMEADKLLDHALKALMMPGTTLGERLKYAAYRYPDIRRVWNAHRLRNQLAHETSFYLDPAMARRAIKDFKSALQLLNLL